MARLMSRLTLSKLWPGEESTGTKLFQTEAHAACASSKLRVFVKPPFVITSFSEATMEKREKRENSNILFEFRPLSQLVFKFGFVCLVSSLIV